MSLEADLPYPVSTDNQWRCVGPEKQPCGALLGITDAEKGSIYILRRDLKVFVHDLGGAGISVVCRHCGETNWLFSESVSEEEQQRVKDHQRLSKYK